LWVWVLGFTEFRTTAAHDEAITCDRAKDLFFTDAMAGKAWEVGLKIQRQSHHSIESVTSAKGRVMQRK
jgi:hypothetical protein